MDAGLLTRGGLVTVESVIYLDQAFLINFIMDFFILWTSGKLGKLTIKLKRLFLGAFIGAGYVILLFFPPLSFVNTILCKILCSFFMIIIAFKFQGWRDLLKAILYFYLVSFVLGGAVLGCMHLFSNNPLYIETWNGIVMSKVDFKMAWLFIAIFMAILLGLLGRSAIRRNIQQGSWLVEVKILMFKKEITCTALVDTGNQLKDPISKDPVMVIEYEQLVNILPVEIIDMLKKEQNPSLDSLATSFGCPFWETRLRLIPFASLGNQHGMLLGFKPDKLIIFDQEKKYSTENAIVAIYNNRLCPQGSYKALIHTDMLTNF